MRYARNSHIRYGATVSDHRKQQNQELGTKTLKFLLKLEKGSRERVFERIKKLGDNPFPSGVKKLKGEWSVYRIRIGDFRVLYRVIPEDDVILVFRVDKRSKVYGR